MADKRPYTKRNDEYWQNRHNRPTPAPQPIVVHAAAPTPAPSSPAVPFPTIEYGSTEVSRASAINGGSTDTLTRGAQVNSGLSDVGAFQNIRAIPSAFGGFGGERGYIGCSEAISLCVKAWTGISTCRNAVEVPVEFSSQPLTVKCSNATVKRFFDDWITLAQIPRLVPQFFRGYYREGNVFLYSSMGQLGTAHFENFQRAFGAKQNRVPIRYDILNPSNVFVPTGVTYPYTYVRMLSMWECERLRNPITEQDKQVYADLPPEAKEQIRNGGASADGVYLNMDPQRLRFAFFKRQAYEPMGVPMLWPVLPDIEFKLALKKMDCRLARTIEHAILLVTTGEAPSKENGGNGINQNNIARLQRLFANQTIGRVLVADYSTKAQWLIPDIQEILGPEKYQVVNDDIKEGLQSILSGGDKFANAQIKAKIFIQRLEEGQQAFLDDFLMPEVRSICAAMGFRHIPSIAFRKIDLQDETVFARIITQLGQIGVLTAPQVVEAIETGVLPDGEEMESGQQAYKKARDKGLYQPLIGGQKDDEGGGANGRPGGTSGIKQSGQRSSSPIGTSKAAQDAFSMKTLGECVRESEALAAEVEKTLRKRHKVKGEFTAEQQAIAHKLVTKIVATQPRGKWTEAVASVIAAPPMVPSDIASDLDDIRLTYSEPGHEVDEFEAALLRHCRTDAPAAAA